jgi:hypothetical protein
MRTAPAEKPSDERVVLKLTEMKESLASKYPANNQIEQNTVHRKQSVPLLAAVQILQSLAEFDFFEIFQKDFASSEVCSVLQCEFSLDFADECGRLHLKGAPFFGYCVLHKHYSTKDLEPFLLFSEAITFEIRVHKSKGKEFDEVFVYEGRYQGKIVRHDASKKEMDQARLNLRVAVTRAKQNATIVTPSDDVCILLK